MGGPLKQDTPSSGKTNSGALFCLAGLLTSLYFACGWSSLLGPTLAVRPKGPRGVETNISLEDRSYMYIYIYTPIMNVIITIVSVVQWLPFPFLVGGCPTKKSVQAQKRIGSNPFFPGSLNN